MWVVNPNLTVYQDRDDADYAPGYRTYEQERDALEYAVFQLRLRIAGLRELQNSYTERLMKLPAVLRFKRGDQVVVEGMEGLVVKVDGKTDDGYPYLVCLLEREQLDWYTAEEVKPCPSSE